MYKFETLYTGLPRWCKYPKKNPPTSIRDVRDTGSIPESGRSPGGGHGSPLQYSCLESPMTEEPGGLESTACKELDMTDGA